MTEYNEIIQLLQELDGRLDKEMSKRYTGRISRAVHALRQDQLKVERAMLDLISYEDSCSGVGLHNIS